jgi:cyclic pyranopterin phosphate synthase
MLTAVDVSFTIDRDTSQVNIEAMCKVSGQTGVEMEALTAVSIAALTIYDMCKAVDRGMEISAVALRHKEGGKSGVWQRNGDGES